MVLAASGAMGSLKVSSGVLLICVTVACGITTPSDAGTGGGGAGHGGGGPGTSGAGAGSGASGSAGVAAGGTGSGSSGSGGVAEGGTSGAAASNGVGGAGSGMSGGAHAGGTSGGLPSSACIELDSSAPAFDPERGDCGSSPPADLSLHNGLPVSAGGGVAGASSGMDCGVAEVGPAILWCSSPTDIWATDAVSEGYACSPQTALLHWNGTDWTTVFPKSDYYFLSGWGRASDDVWLVGHAGHQSWSHPLVALHWNGSELKRLTLPSNPNLPMASSPFMTWQAAVTGAPSGDAWILFGDSSWRIPAPLSSDCLVPL